MPLSLFPYPLRFTSREYVPRPLEGLAIEMRVSRGFLRLCVEVGCPQKDGAMSVADTLVWLFENYEKVRSLAGFRPLAPIAMQDAPVALRLRMANGVITLLEYGRSRASNWRQKRLLRQAAEFVDRLADRLP